MAEPFAPGIADDAATGRLLDVVSRRSEGGYVLLRYSRRKGARFAPRWHVAVMRGGQQWNNSGETVALALERVLRERLATSRTDAYLVETAL